MYLDFFSLPGIQIVPNQTRPGMKIERNPLLCSAGTAIPSALILQFFGTFSFRSLSIFLSSTRLVVGSSSMSLSSSSSSSNPNAIVRRIFTFATSWSNRFHILTVSSSASSSVSSSASSSASSTIPRLTASSLPVPSIYLSSSSA